MLRNGSFSCFLTLLAGLALAACDGGSSGGSGATAGSGGAGATGGTGGATGGSGGTGGATGGTGGMTGGSGGSGGSGGMTTGGSGGGGGVPQCAEAADCQLINDCCSCIGIAANEPIPDCDIQECFALTCDTLGKIDGAAQCVAGQCVAGFNCDHNTALCDSLPPDCPAGQTAIVNGACWGGCVPADECAIVTGCSQCDGGLACVVELTQAGPAYHCVKPPSGCNGVPSCECMGASVCSGTYNVCTPGQNGEIECSCPDCLMAKHP